MPLSGSRSLTGPGTSGSRDIVWGVIIHVALFRNQMAVGAGMQFLWAIRESDRREACYGNWLFDVLTI